MNIQIARLAALVASLLVAATASTQAGYTLTATSLTPPSATLGGTTFTFAESAGGTQSGVTASNFNVIDVGVTSTTPTTGTDTGTIAITELFTLSGTSGTETFSLNGTLTLGSGNSGGVVSSFLGSTTITGGSGYGVSFAGYAPPSLGSGGVGGTTGNISIAVIPAAIVPEPASVVMLGLGLASVGGVALRRRMAK